MALIAPYLVFPEPKISFRKNKNVVKTVLNHCQAADLKTIYGVGEKLYHRIIKWGSSNEKVEFDDLQNIEGFDLLKIKRISLYLHTF